MRFKRWGGRVLLQALQSSSTCAGARSAAASKAASTWSYIHCLARPHGSASRIPESTQCGLQACVISQLAINGRFW